jgi:hypothetical protein
MSIIWKFKNLAFRRKRKKQEAEFFQKHIALTQKDLRPFPES